MDLNNDHHRQVVEARDDDASIGRDATIIAPSFEAASGNSQGTIKTLDWRSLIKVLTENLGRVEIAVAALVSIILVAAQITLYSIGVESSIFLTFTLNARFLLTIFTLVVICDVTILMIRFRPSSPIEFLSSHPASRSLLSRLMPGLFVLVCLAFFMPTFIQIKSSIPILTDYTWDPTFIAWDKALHGTDPWRLIQPILGYPTVTAAMGYLYHIWFALIHLAPVCIGMYISNKHLKFRFFVGYFLTWSLIGMVSAVALASVGPVFLEPLLGDPHFVEQIAYLNAAHTVTSNPVIEVQEALLLWYENGDFGLGSGITAMPSMHVALAALYAFAMWDLDKRLGIVFVLYLVLIMLGSVHLAYHYAVDGYVSLILVTLIWFATKPLARTILGHEQNSQPQSCKT